MTRGTTMTAGNIRDRTGTGPRAESYRMGAGLSWPGCVEVEMLGKFLLWCILFVLCWPAAILALILYPLVWLVLIPFRLLGIAVGGVLAFIRAVFMFPARLLGGPRAMTRA